MIKVAIVGCTGAVGNTMLQLLHDTEYDILCMASERSSGKNIKVRESEYPVVPFSYDGCASCDIVFLCVSGSFAMEHAERLAKNSFVIDNSSAFRYHKDVPLLVPPVNGVSYQGEKLIANPNCSSAIALMVLGPLNSMYGLESVIVSTYQAASGAGQAAIRELRDCTANFTDYDRYGKSDYFRHNLAFNVIPQVDIFESNGYTKEEMKVVWELRKVLNEPNLAISTTAVRVPTLRSHAESLTLRFRNEINSLDEVRGLLSSSPGVRLVDEPLKGIYPMPMTSTYEHDVEVGRVRYNLIYGNNGLDMFVSGDQLLRGAALNAFEIMQLVCSKS